MPTIEERLERIEAMLLGLCQQTQAKEFYTVEEFARIVGRASLTVRGWARRGRIQASKKLSGRASFASWSISHDERRRYEREGLLPGR